MTARQFSTRIKRFWRTQQEAAAALGVTRGAIGHWELGRRPVPKSIVKFLECIEERNHLEMLVIKYAPKDMGNTISLDHVAKKST
jgi:DNA-binding XRE family transcriptional regulator